MAVDIIKERQRLAAEEEARQKQADAVRAVADAERRRQSQREDSERQTRQAREAEEYHQWVRTTTSMVLQESGVLAELGDIESRLLQGVAKHRILVDLDHANAKLVWGSRFDISPQGAISRRPLMLGLSIDPILDYSYIDVSVDVNSKSLGINGRTFSANEWRERPKIAKALADAYLNPGRVVKDYTPVKSSGSSSGSSNSECCCS
jgi:hypothetical protein